MSKRTNKVWLNGSIKLQSFGAAVIGDIKAPVAHLTITTGLENAGEKHAVIAYGRLAVDVIAFAFASETAGVVLSGVVEGWLRTRWVECTCHPDGYRPRADSVVVVEAITFVVPPDVRANAKVFVTEILSGHIDSNGVPPVFRDFIEQMNRETEMVFNE